MTAYVLHVSLMPDFRGCDIYRNIEVFRWCSGDVPPG